MSASTRPVVAGDHSTLGDELILQISKNIFYFFKWKLIVGSGHNISYHTTAQLPVHVRNHDLICDKKMYITTFFFYKITIKSSETLVKRKFPLQ